MIMIEDKGRCGSVVSAAGGTLRAESDSPGCHSGCLPPVEVFHLSLVVVLCGIEV